MPFRELSGKKQLTNAEMMEKISLSPPGSFLALPNLLTIGVVDLHQFMENMGEVTSRSRHARKNGCYIEVLSLRLQFMDLWLRMYWVVCNGSGRVFEPDDRRTFGNLIADCERLGFDPGLINRMREFNEARVDAIHKYLLGATTYQALEAACVSSGGLADEVMQYVGKRVGTPLTFYTQSLAGLGISEDAERREAFFTREDA